jgi:hypothetical protein
MSKTVAELVTWLQSQDSIRMVLVEVEGVTGSGSATLYLSSKPYTTLVSEAPSGVSYDPCIIGGLSFSESISLDLAASIGYGDIEITNYDGSRDSWLNWVWANRTVKIFLGDPRWPRTDFYPIFTGVISDITASSTTSLNLVLLNKLDRLNNPISEKTLGSLFPKIGETGGIAGNEIKPVGAVQNRDSILPLCFGECFNVTPLLISSALGTGTTSELTYMIHDGPIEAIIEVRDNGVPLDLGTGYTVNLTQGTFTLLRAPAGVITVSVQGAKFGVGPTYSNNPGAIIEHIVTTYGPASQRLSSTDLNAINFTAIKGNERPVGIYISDRENIIDICNRLANGLGASVVCSAAGLLQVIVLDIPGFAAEAGVPTHINEYNTVLNSISIADKPAVQGTVKLGYCYNWTVQSSGLAGAIPQWSQDLFAKDWLYITKKDTSITADYKLDSQPVAVESLIVEESIASDEAARRLALWKEPRFIYTVTAFPEMLMVEPGMSVTLTNSRFGLSNKSGTVVSIDRNWITGMITIGVLV